MLVVGRRMRGRDGMGGVHPDVAQRHARLCGHDLPAPVNDLARVDQLQRADRHLGATRPLEQQHPGVRVVRGDPAETLQIRQFGGEHLGREDHWACPCSGLERPPARRLLQRSSATAIQGGVVVQGPGATLARHQVSCAAGNGPVRICGLDLSPLERLVEV